MSKYAVLQDVEDDDTDMEPVPVDQDAGPHHIGHVVVVVKQNKWGYFDGSLPHGMVSKKIPCGMIRFEGSNVEKDCSFALYTDDNANNKRIKMMASLKHPNLINGIVFALRGRLPWIHHELALNSISGTMEEFVTKHFKVFFSKKTHVLSDRFLKFLRGMIDAISVVHHKGFFHGDVQKKNMLYHESNDEYVFFLANYDGREEKNVRRQQVSDWRGLGWSIESILRDYVAVRQKQNCTKGKGKKKVQDYSGRGAYEDYTCVALNDLIKILKDADEKKLIVVKDMALNSMPFQKVHERQRYITVLVPEFMRCNASYGRMLETHSRNFVTMPWTTSSCTFYLQEMLDYRKRIHGKDMPYDGDSGIAFINYVSGVYSHFHEFRRWDESLISNVDLYFRKECPTLFQALKYIEEKVFPQGPPIS